MGEHLLCKQGVVGSIPSASTSAVLRLDDGDDRIGKEQVRALTCLGRGTVVSRAVV